MAPYSIRLVDALREAIGRPRNRPAAVRSPAGNSAAQGYLLAVDRLDCGGLERVSQVGSKA